MNKFRFPKAFREDLSESVGYSEEEICFIEKRETDRLNAEGQFDDVYEAVLKNQKVQ